MRGLTRTRQSLAAGLRQMTGSVADLDEEKLEEIEEILIRADCGVQAAGAVLEGLRHRRETGAGGEADAEDGVTTADGTGEATRATL